MTQGKVLLVAVRAPLRSTFEYLPPKDAPPNDLPSGTRVRVPWGRTTQVGMILGTAGKASVSPERLKRIIEVLDPTPLLPNETVSLLSWAASYYHHPVGEVFLGTLPTMLRRGRALQMPVRHRWRVTAAGATVTPATLVRSPRQAETLAALQANPQGLDASDLPGSATGRKGTLDRLAAKGWVECVRLCEPDHLGVPKTSARQLSAQQQTAIEAVFDARHAFKTFLLEGVTGSGKTEVYLQLIERFRTHGLQTLLLVPEIGLTPQTVARLRNRLGTTVAVLHSGLADGERLQAWTRARNGDAGVVIGTRSAVFAPLKRPGLFVVDEEQDLSYKQQDGFRYSARDLAIVRARQAGVPAVLGSATPSLESLHNAAQGRYHHLLLADRVGGAAHPSVEVIDVRGQPFAGGLSDRLLAAVRIAAEKGEQSLLFLNRRGYAPVLICHACGWTAECERCDARLVYHRAPASGLLRCHHCGAERHAPPLCPQCSRAELQHLGAGTQQVADRLASELPNVRVARIDRDSTTRKGSLEAVLGGVRSGDIDVLIGTQMLAKGHHFPNVTLVGILDADGGLFGADFRSAERLAQLLVQVAGRAGRGERPGRVLIQTHHPEHPLLGTLLNHGYQGFADAALAERCEAGLPPYGYLALLRAEATKREQTVAFLEEARRVGESRPHPELTLLGPVMAPMERRAGHYRAQILLECRRRSPLHQFLDTWLAQIQRIKTARRVRWSIDVDPQEVV